MDRGLGAVLGRFRGGLRRRRAVLVSIVLLACSLCAVGSAAAATVQLYRSVDTNGNVTFSQVPPADAVETQPITVAVGPAAAPPAALSPAELDSLLAPIALYPDQLLGNILMAATYPLEVVEAARWVRDPNNAALQGDRLAEALAREDWAPSVKALVPFPEVLRMMDSRLGWMQRLGNAFLAQEADVMSSVQRLRRAAEAAGSLRSTPQQTVVTSGSTVVIEPAEPQVVYVPYYDPFVVYGAWPYRAYPPVYFPLPSVYVTGVLHPLSIFFGVGITVASVLWNWHRWDWRDRRLYVDVRRFNALNARRPPITRNLWTHEPYHRRGVVYPTRQLQERYRHTRTFGAPGGLRDYRGYPAPRRPVPARPLTRPAPRRIQPRAAQPRRVPGSRTTTRPRLIPQRAAPRSAQPLRVPGSRTTTRPSLNQGAAPVRRQQPRSAPAPRSRSAPAARRSPPAFRGIGQGGAVRRESLRGRGSRTTTRPGLNQGPRAVRPVAPRSSRQGGPRRLRNDRRQPSGGGR